MELLQNYPIAFLVTVVFPIVSGMALAIGGYDSLKARAESDGQLNRIEQNTETTLKQMPDINATLGTLARYEKTLSEAGQRDEVLSAVLTQYKGMKRAADLWVHRKPSADHEEKAQLAAEVLDVLSTNLTAVSTAENLPSKPLILNTGNNTFRVLFAVPMRIPPQLEFSELPSGSTANVTEKSKFGFTVMFSPSAIPVSHFGFSADARL